MVVGISFLIMVLTNGSYEVVFQVNIGNLYTFNIVIGVYNWLFGMKVGTSFLIIVLSNGSYEVVYQANIGYFYIFNSNIG